jgi:hypothetical protein
MVVCLNWELVCSRVVQHAWLRSFVYRKMSIWEICMFGNSLLNVSQLDLISDKTTR